MDRLKEINEVISAEILEPDVGVPYEYVLSGFESDWTEQTRIMASPTLIPDPPKKVASTVTVPETNRHLSKNQGVWKQCSQEAIISNNKKHQHYFLSFWKLLPFSTACVCTFSFFMCC